MSMLVHLHGGSLLLSLCVCVRVCTTAALYKTGTLSFYHVSCQRFRVFFFATLTTENEGKKRAPLIAQIQTHHCVAGKSIRKANETGKICISRQNISLHLVGNIFRYQYVKCFKGRINIFLFCSNFHGTKRNANTKFIGVTNNFGGEIPNIGD